MRRFASQLFPDLAEPPAERRHLPEAAFENHAR
jgi:hypothetical protein